jgi:hypothetical protein
MGSAQSFVQPLAPVERNVEDTVVSHLRYDGPAMLAPYGMEGLSRYVIKRVGSGAGGYRSDVWLP